MNFAVCFAILFALFAMVAGQGCPANFEKEGHQCTAKRTIRGECPQGSEYKVNINKCVYGQ